MQAQPDQSSPPPPGKPVTSRFAVWRDRLRFRRGGKWIVIGVVGLGVMGAVSVEVTSQSSFCNSCHIMEPYYDSWKVGSHKSVACVECHISPGVNNFVAAKLNGLGQVVDDVLHRTSLKPSASVSQLSCTRSGCHSVETLSAKEIKNDVFKFRHDKHLGQKHLGVEISCATCHSHVRGDKHFEVSTNVCVTCHLVGAEPTAENAFAEGAAPVIRFVARDALTDRVAPEKSPASEKIPPDACTTCHDAPKGPIEFQGISFDHSKFLSFGAACESCHKGVTATPPQIDDGRCLQCHTFGVERSLGAPEMHRIHTIGEHKIECSSCHGWVRHGAKVQVASLERFECTNCHAEQHNAQRSNYFSGAAAHPAIPGERSNPMFLSHVDCTGCHTTPRPNSLRPGSGEMVMAATPEACDRCHQAGYGQKMIPLWQNATRRLFGEIEGQLAAAAAAAPGNAALDDVKSLLAQVKSDGSWGVHNPNRAQQLLMDARRKLNSIKATPASTPASAPGGTP